MLGSYQYLTVEQVAGILEICPSQVMRLFRKGILTVSRERPFIILKADLDEAIIQGFQLPLPIHNP